MKACCNTIICCLKLYFISHMVQMKVLQKSIQVRFNKTLYPTWFRWKTYIIISLIIYISTLYPTWFRWKRPALACLSSPSYFISHMVQMKVQGPWAGSNAVTTLYPTWFRWKLTGVARKIAYEFALYPTWFRWKTVNNAYAVEFSTDLYIPHGSDERKTTLVRRFRPYALYPTWFRWKKNHPCEEV